MISFNLHKCFYCPHHQESISWTTSKSCQVSTKNKRRLINADKTEHLLFNSRPHKAINTEVSAGGRVNFVCTPQKVKCKHEKYNQKKTTNELPAKIQRRKVWVFQRCFISFSHCHGCKYLKSTQQCVLYSLFLSVLRSILLSTENTPAAESRCGDVMLGAGLSIAPAQHQSAGSAKYKGLEEDTWLKLRNNAQEEGNYTVIVQGVAYRAYNLTKPV